MKYELNFKPSNKHPQMGGKCKDYLVVDHDHDYYIARAMFDESGDFFCFIADAIGDSGYPLHPHEYIAWFELPPLKEISDEPTL